MADLRGRVTGSGGWLVLPDKFSLETSRPAVNIKNALDKIIFRLTRDCKSPHYRRMTEDTWKIINNIAEQMGIGWETRRKWRQRGVSHYYQARIIEEARSRRKWLTTADMGKME